MRHLFLILFILSFHVLKSQNEFVAKPPRDYIKHPAKNAAFIEIGGNDGLYSLNFDRIYFYKEKLKLSARVGFAVNPNGYYFEQGYVLEQNIILFKNPHHLEIGFGGLLQRLYNEKCYEAESYFWESIWYGTLRCGYRYQKHDDGFFFKAAITPIIMQKSNCGFKPNYFQWWAGLGIGLSF